MDSGRLCFYRSLALFSRARNGIVMQIEHGLRIGFRSATAVQAAAELTKNQQQHSCHGGGNAPVCRGSGARGADERHNRHNYAQAAHGEQQSEPETRSAFVLRALFELVGHLPALSRSRNAVYGAWRGGLPIRQRVQ